MTANVPREAEAAEETGAAPGALLACGRALGDPPGNDRSKQWSNHVPPPAERDRLAATLGRLLRELRAEHGLSTRALAVRSTVARSTITRLESGERRPRPSTLAALAYGLDHERPGPIAERLIAAAGDSLRPDTPGGRRRRSRRIAKARRAAGRQMWRMRRAAEAAHAEAFRLNTTVLARVPIAPAKANPTAAELDAEWQQLHALEDLLHRSGRLSDRAQMLRRALARPRHPLEDPLDPYARWKLTSGR